MICAGPVTIACVLKVCKMAARDGWLWEEPQAQRVSVVLDWLGTIPTDVLLLLKAVPWARVRGASVSFSLDAVQAERTAQVRRPQGTTGGSGQTGF